MEEKQNKIIGSLLLVFMVFGIFIIFENVKIKVDNNKTTFYTKLLDDNGDAIGRWIVSGREYNKLFDGTSGMYRSLSGVSVETVFRNETGIYYFREGKQVEESKLLGDIILEINDMYKFRYTPYIRGPIVKDTYYFNGDIDDVEQFPISHKIEIFNGTGYFYRYEVRDLIYDGPSLSLEETSMDFGRNMKVTWQDDYRWAKVYKSGILKVQYDIDSDYEVFENRLFDPPTNLYLEGFDRDITAELGSIINITSTGTDTICIDVDHPQGGINVTCGTSPVQYDFNATYFRKTTIPEYYCYQETANISTACGGLSTGVYNIVTNYYNGWLYINYTKPENTTANTVWLVKIGTLPPTNVSLSNCWGADNNKIILRLASLANSGTAPWNSNADCYNGSEWITLLNDVGSSLHPYSTSVSPSLIYDGNWSTGASRYAGAWRDINEIFTWLNIYEEGVYWGYNYTVFNMTLNSTQNGTFYIKSNQYDDIENVSINLTGFDSGSGFPNNVKIYINDTISNIIGNLFNTTILTTDKFNDTTTIETIGFASASIDSTNTIKLPKISSVTSAKLTITGSNDTVYVSGYNIKNPSFETDDGNSSWNFTNAVVDGSTTFNGFYTTESTGGFPTNGLQYYNIHTGCLSLMTSGYGQITQEVNLTNIYNIRVTARSRFGYIVGDAEINDSFYIDGSYIGIIQPIVSQTTGIYTFNVSSYTGLHNITFKRYLISPQTEYICSVGYENYLYLDNILEGITIYPEDVWLKVGIIDGTKDFSQAGILSTSNTTTDVSDSINDYLSSCTADTYGFCNVPINIYSSGAGRVDISDLVVNYTYNENPVQLDIDVIQAYLDSQIGEVNIPIKITSATESIIEISDLKYDYRGGNSTIEVNAHTQDYGTEITHNIIYYSSDWNYSYPTGIQYLDIYPTTPTSQNVKPFGQTNSVGIFNIDPDIYGSTTFDFYINVNESHECVNLSTSPTNLKSGGEVLNTSWYKIKSSADLDTNFYMWMWADFNCDYSSWATWFPNINFRACRTGVDVCDEDI